MMFCFGRYRSPFRHPVITMRVGHKNVSIRSWFVASNTIRQYTPDGKPKSSGTQSPHRDRLAKAILSPPHLLLEAAFNPEKETKFKKRVFAKLELDIPEKLPDSYETSDQYSYMLQRLVVEEAISSVTQSLEQCQSQTPKEIRKDSVRVRTVDYTGPNPSITKGKRRKSDKTDRWVDAYCDSPLSTVQRKNLRTGAIVVLVPARTQVTEWDKAIFGYILRGSDDGTRLPAQLENSKGEKAKKGPVQPTTNLKHIEDDTGIDGKKETPHGRDRLTLRIFGDTPAELEMYCVATILNSIRQFHACESFNDDFSLNGELLGTKAPSSCAEEVDIIGSEVSGPDSESSLCQQLREDLVWSRITIPALNESQQRACDGFVSDGGARIHIVQGPPGTGKATMIVATILQYFMKSRPSGDKRRLMVCGPSNKSVVVLIRKTLQCLDGTDTLKVALIGDKDELFADYQDEISHVYVHSYLQSMALKWKALGEPLLEDESLYERYEQDTRSLLSEMKSRLQTTDFKEVEEGLLDIRNGIESLNEFQAAIKSRNVELSVKIKQKIKERKNKKKGTTDDEEKAWNESVEILANEIKRRAAVAEFRGKVEAVSMLVENLDTERVVRDLLATAHVIFCTLSASGSVPMSRMKPVDALIVDEASACTEPDILIPLRKKPARLLLVGDPKQLPSVVNSPLATEYGLSRSLQDRLMFRNQFDFTLLNQQYRMRPEISRFPLKTFYDEMVLDGDNVAQPMYKSDVSILDGEPYCWVQVASEEKKDKALSTFNVGEAEMVVSILLDMKHKYCLSDDWFSADRLRVITFYQAQVEHINILLRKHGLEGVMVSTVDSSQGCEADIVILSFVRGSSGHVGFLKDNPRLNVALTRARFQLVCVGNIDAISSLAVKGGHFQLLDLAQDAFNRSRIYRNI